MRHSLHTFYYLYLLIPAMFVDFGQDVGIGLVSSTVGATGSGMFINNLYNLCKEGSVLGPEDSLTQDTCSKPHVAGCGILVGGVRRDR